MWRCDHCGELVAGARFSFEGQLEQFCAMCFDVLERTGMPVRARSQAGEETWLINQVSMRSEGVLEPHQKLARLPLRSGWWRQLYVS
jgi:hypothetical protein